MIWEFRISIFKVQSSANDSKNLRVSNDCSYYTIDQIIECIDESHISTEGKKVTAAKLLGIRNEKEL